MFLCIFYVKVLIEMFMGIKIHSIEVLFCLGDQNYIFDSNKNYFSMAIDYLTTDHILFCFAYLLTKNYKKMRPLVSNT